MFLRASIPLRQLRNCSLSTFRKPVPPLNLLVCRTYSSKHSTPLTKRKMGKNNKKSRSTPPGEEHLLLPTHPHLVSQESTSAQVPAIVDTHTHLLSTFHAYTKAYKPGKFENAWDFARGLYDGRGVEAIVDVWCEAPVQKAAWKELADSAVNEEDRKVKWGGLEYWFVMGTCTLGLFCSFRYSYESLHDTQRCPSVSLYLCSLLSSHPRRSHEAKHYNDEVENDMFVSSLSSIVISLVVDSRIFTRIEAMSHPRCVGWGEIGLDYHYDNSPREIQRDVFIRQLRQAVRLGKPITVHTREAEEDAERILKEEVPKDHRVSFPSQNLYYRTS